MSPARWPWLAASAALVVAACNTVGSCRQSRGVAELVALTGRVERSEGALASWRAAPVGANFALGDAVRTGPASTARVRVGTGGFNLGASSMVRFVASPVQGTATSLRVESGAAELEPLGEDLIIDTAVGHARLERNSRVRVEAGGGGDGGADAGEPRLQVILGRVVLERSGGRSLTVLAGQRMVVRVSGAPVIEPINAPAARRDAGAAAPSVRNVATADATAPADAALLAVASDAGGTTVTDAGAADAALLAVAADAGAAAADAGPPVVPREAMVIALQGGRGGVTVLEPGAGAQWHPLGQGRHNLPPGTRMRVPVGARLALRRGNDRRFVLGAAELVLGNTGEALASEPPAATAVASTATGGSGGSAASATGAGAANGAAGASVAATAVADAGVAPPAPSGAPDAGAGGGATAVASATSGEAGASGPAYVATTAGESSLIHSTASVTPVRVRVAERCPGGAVVQTAGHGALTARGADAVLLELSPGRHRYTVRCAEPGRPPAGRTVAAGTLTVVRDAGDAVMPRRAPHSEIDADGRNYSVLYQNLLPEITFRWPRPPAGSSVVLNVRDHAGRVRRFERGPGDNEVGVGSGQLAEGTYRFWFTAGVSRSPETTLRVAFDNAARSASLTEPPDSAPLAPGSTVRVAGTALAGSVVSVGGTHLPLDAQNRFHGEVTVPRGEPALTIRIAHPARGVQYYVRRIATPGGP